MAGIYPLDIYVAGATRRTGYPCGSGKRIGPLCLSACRKRRLKGGVTGPPMMLQSHNHGILRLDDPAQFSHQVQTGPIGSTWYHGPLTKAFGLSLDFSLFEVHIAPHASTSCLGLLHSGKASLYAHMLRAYNVCCGEKFLAKTNI